MKLLPILVALVRRPDLWKWALVAMHVFATPQWWRKAPFLPLPSQRFVEFRVHTAYGDGTNVSTQHAVSTFDAAEAIQFLEWLRQWDSLG